MFLISDNFLPTTFGDAMIKAWEFIDTWKELEEEGKCDALGGLQFNRVSMIYFHACCPDNVRGFIIEYCNEPAPTRPRK